MGKYAPLTFLITSVVVVATASPLLARWTAPQLPTDEVATNFSVDQESSPRAAVLITSPDYEATSREIRASLLAAERDARFLQGGLIGGASLGVAGYFVLALIARAKAAHLTDTSAPEIGLS